MMRKVPIKIKMLLQRHKESKPIEKMINKEVCIPYAKLCASPVTIHFGQIPVTLSLCDPVTCHLSVPSTHLLPEAAYVRVGTSFVLEYKGLECEVRLGRRIMVTDGLDPI
jgi:hypothetical protein